ncbi:MucR family transcriptional regulator [Magnetospira sp. QH-2]|uniref:MucR family transcriptional regulator n=1 Tax=Magnetospira sp. (strain QH-2) TaxID=1288970 RepID=UPI0003E80EA6|nr:MucR family transcriptional regulator [Magnetospira sp. QH-2]CCQ73834.1 Transcriptional regulatory protein, Ros/MucR family [Magnetospira sp. QH-2]
MSDENMEVISNEDILQMSVDIVAAYVGNNSLPASQISDVITTVYGALKSLDNSGPAAEEVLKPAVTIKKSITPDYLVCLEDGKKMKMLKRYLRTTYGMTAEEYRSKWNLPADYPMVAPNYAAQRSEFAKKIGLGKKGGRKKA